MEKKSYNAQALTGDLSYTDKVFQGDMRKEGIDIPDNLLYTPDMNEFVAGKIKEQNIKGYLEAQSMDPKTGLPFTPERAEELAERKYQEAIKSLSAFY